MSVTDELVDFVEQVRYENLSLQIVETVKRSVLNIISAIMAGSSTVVTAKLVNLVKEWQGKAEGTILLFGDKVPTPNAAWVNSVMARGLDYDEVHEVIGHPGIGHVNASIIPAVFALSEYSTREKKRKITGKDFILAIAIGQELTCRLTIASKKVNFDWLAEAFTMLAIAALGGKMLNRGKVTIHNAIGIAYFECFGHLGAAFGEGSGFMPALGQGLATKEGVLSVILADKGFSAQQEILDGTYGFYSTCLHTTFDPEVLTGGLGEQYISTNVNIKAYPGCSATQYTISGILELVQEHKIEVENVDKVIFKVAERFYDVLAKGKGKPSSALDALWSYPYSTAVALSKGKVSIEDFTETAIKEPEVLKIIDSVYTEIDPRKANSRIADIEIIMKNGTRYQKTMDHFKGDFKNPMTSIELAEKLRNCNRYSIKPLQKKSIENLIQLINIMEDVDDITKIIRLLI